MMNGHAGPHHHRSERMEPTNLERTNLEAHVDLCQQRYLTLERRLDTIEVKVMNVHSDIINGNKSLTKVLITTAGTIVAGLLSTIVVVIIAFM